MTRVQKMFQATLLSLVLNAAMTATAAAAVLSSQAPKDGGIGLEANYSIGDLAGAQNAESYVLGGPSVVTEFRWWGTDVADLSSFVVRRFNSLVPDVTASIVNGTVTKTATALKDSADTDIYEFNFALASALTLAGSGYVSVFLDSLDPWYWLEGLPGDNESAFRGVEGDDWQTAAPDLSLALFGDRVFAVPEPATILLMAAALAALSGNRRRRSARAG